MIDVWLAVASGLLLALAAPGAGVRAGAVAWVALVPLFRAIAGAGIGRAASLGWLTGFAFAAGTLWWLALPVALHSRLGLGGGLAVAGLAAVAHALPLGAYAAALAFFERRTATFGIALATALWAALEWMRTLGPLPLPWSLLGYSQPAHAAVAQLGEWTGVYGVGAVVVLVNAAIHVGTSRRQTDRRTAARLATATLVVILAFALGEWRRSRVSRPEPGPSRRIGVVQPNLAPNVPADPGAAELLTRHLAIVPLDLIVWPEGAVPFAILDGAEDGGDEDLAPDRVARDRLAALARELDRPLVAGAGAVVAEPLGRGQAWTSRNRVVAIAADGTLVGRVDKRILVPFGETVPLGALFRGVDALIPGRGEYRPGTGAPVLSVAGIEAAVVICWEAIFPAYVAAAAADASLILDLTNDAWLGTATAAEQHFAMAAMRAVETRKPLVRAANSGISAFVDADGSVRRKTAYGVTAAILGEVRPRVGATFYSRHGDVFAIAAALAALGLLVYAAGSRPRGEEGGVLPLET